MNLTWHAELSSVQAEEVSKIAEEDRKASGQSALSEQTLLVANSRGKLRGQHLLATQDGAVIGYLFADALTGTSSIEVLVAVGSRRRGVGTLLFKEVLSQPDLTTVQVWAHAPGLAVEKICDKFSLKAKRVLLQMSSDLADLPEASDPDPMYSFRTFVVGRDEQALLDLNSAAFRSHPEQGAWTMDDLEARSNEAWFDPDGIFLSFAGDDLAGFHWTKLHNGVEGLSSGVVGEVYVVGIAPGHQGRGLGKYLTLKGLNYFASRRLTQAMLYVEESNAAAVKVYRSLGFDTFAQHIMYESAARGER